MTALINHSIPAQRFEDIRDRIALILQTELDNQVANYYLEALHSTVYIERTIPVNADAELDEHCVIIVSLASGTYDNQHMANADGTYSFNIDVYASAKSTNDDMGDKLANVILHRVAGACRAIVQDPVYKTLGFNAPSISRVLVSEIQVADHTTKNRMGLDAENVNMARVTVQVRANESVALLTAVAFQQSSTAMTLYLSAKGYSFTRQA